MITERYCVRTRAIGEGGIDDDLVRLSVVEREADLNDDGEVVHSA